MDSRIEMYQALDEDGSRVQVARIVPRFRVARLATPGFVEGPPQWLTGTGERLKQLPDNQLEVVRTRRRLQMVRPRDRRARVPDSP